MKKVLILVVVLGICWLAYLGLRDYARNQLPFFLRPFLPITPVMPMPVWPQPRPEPRRPHHPHPKPHPRPHEQ